MGDVIIDGLTGANRLVILDANGKIPALDGSLVTAIAGANFSSGTIPVARIDTGSTAGKIVKLDGNAKLPAVSGAALTGITSATKSASDPVITTNPSGGVGTEWQNTTSGAVFICTDATAGENVWINVGGRSGDVAPWAFGGTSYGWVYGGYTSPPAQRTAGIDQIPFASDGNATDIGDQSVARDSWSGCNSPTHGYCLGGYKHTAPNTQNVIDRAPFASGGTMTDVGDMIQKIKNMSSSSSETYGYTAGGYLVGGEGGAGNYNYIQRVQFAASANAVDIGDLTMTWADNPAGCSDVSNSYGYIAGGGSKTEIERYAMSSSTSGADVGDITVARGWLTGQSSATYGYASGSGPGGYASNNRIDKFAFAASSNSTNIGNMTVPQFDACGVSSTTHGYIAGGYHSSNNVIEKFSFTTDGNSTDVGDLTVQITYLGSVGSNY